MANFHLNEKGVWYTPSSAGDGKTPEPIWICSFLEIVAITRDDLNKNYGRLLRFFDSDGKEHLWAMPMELLANDGAECRKVLLSEGLLLSPEKGARCHLLSYIQSTQPIKKMRCIDRVGWHGNRYVLPMETLGKSDDEEIIFQGLSQTQNPYGVSRTLEDWKKNVAHFCVDNSGRSFAVSSAFAAPLLNIMKEESGGIHFRGKSSSEKTTTLKVAASAFGGKEMLGSWRATSNGLEATAVIHNDCLLCLDELGQLDPREAGECAYLLANGVGKTRANKMAYAREKRSWTLIFLSTGEISLAHHVSSSGQKCHAGQEVRVVDIPVDTRKHGAFEELHGYSSGADFSRMLSENTTMFYGTAGRAFIEVIAQDIEKAKKRVKELCSQFIEQNTVL